MMTCTVCKRPDRKEIDLAIVAGGTAVSIAAAFGLQRKVVARHKERCLSLSLSRAAAERERVVDAGEILDRAEALAAKTDAVLERALQHKATTFTEISKLVRESRENLKTIGHLIGAFPKEPATTTTIVDQRHQTVSLAIGDMTAAEIRAALTALRPTIDA